MHVVSSSRKGRGKFKVFCEALDCRSFMGSPREPMVVKFQDHPRWSTRQPRWRLMEHLQGPVGRLARRRFMKQPQDHLRWSTRQPRWRLMRRMCARGLTTHCLSTPRNAKEIGRTVQDSFCTGAQEVCLCGWSGACEWSTPWGWEAADLPRVTLAAPQPQNNHKQDTRRGA